MNKKIYLKDLYFETKRLIIRPFKKSDAISLVENYNDKVYSKNIPNIPFPYTLKDANSFISKTREKLKDKKPTIDLAVYLKSEKKVIGGITISNIDFKNKKAESGSLISKKYWGTGIIYEAKLELYNYVFKELKFNRLYSYVFSYNPRSKKHLEKLGFKQEGYLRKDYFHKNKFNDMYVMGLLKREFNYSELKKKLLR